MLFLWPSVHWRIFFRYITLDRYINSSPQQNWQLFKPIRCKIKKTNRSFVKLLCDTVTNFQLCLPQSDCKIVNRFMVKHKRTEKNVKYRYRKKGFQTHTFINPANANLCSTQTIKKRTTLTLSSYISPRTFALYSRAASLRWKNSSCNCTGLLDPTQCKQWSNNSAFWLCSCSFMCFVSTDQIVQFK